MLKRFIPIFLILFFAYSFARAEISQGNLTVNGSVKTEVSLRAEGGDSDLSKFKNFVELAGEYKIKDDALVFFTKARYWYDAAYDFRDKLDPAQHYMGHVQRNDWLRDCYLDYNNGPWFLRLGKQQVSWGQSDGITILDRVNPMDVTEYVLPDMADIRIPLWMANINYAPKLNSNLQVLIIPDFEQSTAAPPGAPFTIRAYKLLTSFKDSFEAAPNSAGKFNLGPPLFRNYRGTLNTNIYYPPKQFENSKFGVQWQDRFSGWDYTLNYLYGFDYMARTYLDSTVVRIPPVPGTVTLNYSRRFKLVQMAGASLNHTFTNEGPLEGITLRSDYAVYLNEPTCYGDPVTGSSKGVNRWNNVFWLMGLDKYVITNWLVSFQFAQYIMEHDKPGINDPVTRRPYSTLSSSTNGAQDTIENIFSLKISTDFMHERLKPEVLWSFTDDNQGRLSPKLTYEIRDNLWLTLGIHYFYGNEADSNGQFRDQNQVYGSLKYTF